MKLEVENLVPSLAFMSDVTGFFPSEACGLESRSFFPPLVSLVLPNGSIELQDVRLSYNGLVQLIYFIEEDMGVHSC